MFGLDEFWNLTKRAMIALCYRVANQLVSLLFCDEIVGYSLEMISVWPKLGKS